MNFRRRDVLCQLGSTSHQKSQRRCTSRTTMRCILCQRHFKVFPDIPLGGLFSPDDRDIVVRSLHVPNMELKEGTFARSVSGVVFDDRQPKRRQASRSGTRNVVCDYTNATICGNSAPSDRNPEGVTISVRESASKFTVWRKDMNSPCCGRGGGLEDSYVALV